MFCIRASARTAVITAALLSSALAWSQVTTVQQTLDSVKVHSDTAVLNMNFDDPALPDFTNSNINGSNYRACKHTGFGLYCLDGDVVERTPNINNPVTVTAIDCKDLNLDNSKGAPCTAMTVDLTGTVWLGGKSKGKSHVLVKATPNPNGDNCSPATGIQGNTYCVTEVATGRPLLVDLTSVDGDSGSTFVHGPGILGLEERKTAIYFKSAPGDPEVIASGKSGWGLIGNEQLISAAAIQFVNSDSDPDSFESYVLATTTKLRVLAKRVLEDGTGEVGQVFDIGMASYRASEPPADCPASDDHFGIRTSGKTGTIYLTDRQYCTVTALQANPGNNGILPIGSNSLVVADVLSTIDSEEGAHAPIAPTVAPGINVSLKACSENCPLILDGLGEAIAELNNVNVISEEDGLTLYQVKNIPDCRYDRDACYALLGGSSLAELEAADVIWDQGGNGLPHQQLLNLTKLLPMEITEQFMLGDPLPDMWLPGQYRGQEDKGFVFEAFFGVTENGVIFRDTFEGVFDVDALAGSELGCHTGLPNGSPLYTTNGNIGTLEWDVVGTVSERVATNLGDGPQHVATITNSGCGSSKSSGTRWSIKPYNLEITPCTYNSDPNDVWEGECPASGDDAVFAKLLLSLFDDFKAVLDNHACQEMQASECATLQANWTNAKDKLDKCWSATKEPKQSSGAQNCTSFVSQLDNLRSAVDSITEPGPLDDLDNRIGELKSRLQVITHVHDERFVPSIPDDGFCEPEASCSAP